MFRRSTLKSVLTRSGQGGNHPFKPALGGSVAVKALYGNGCRLGSCAHSHQDYAVLPYMLASADGS